ncbi:MAG: rod shape-determining protein MreC [Deltaproteobacteria bacterium]|jgi:rod shape-determining protein MreC|nr:rod shape-determining protein MreC [Deltaproteobacteria bacterium]
MGRWKRLVPFILVMACLTLLSLSYKNRSSTPVNRASLEVVGPVGSFMDSLALFVEEVWFSYFQLVGVKEENDSLKRMVERQNRQIIQLTEERTANERLRRLLGFKITAEGRYIGAKIVAWDPGPWYQSMVIDVGSADGVFLNCPVVTEAGVVGRVAEITSHYAKVLLITDPGSGIDAFIQRNRVHGLLSGQGSSGLMSLDYVRKADDVRPGDLVVTSGLDGIFPSGLSIGSVTIVDKKSLGLFLEAQVNPSVDLNGLEEVLVKLDPQLPLDWMALGGDLKKRFEEQAQAPK